MPYSQAAAKSSAAASTEGTDDPALTQMDQPTKKQVLDAEIDAQHKSSAGKAIFLESLAVSIKLLPMPIIGFKCRHA